MPRHVFSVFHPWLLCLFGSGDAGLYSCFPKPCLVIFRALRVFAVPLEDIELLKTEIQN
jgi:hypothetical protein